MYTLCKFDTNILYAFYSEKNCILYAKLINCLRTLHSAKWLTLRCGPQRRVEAACILVAFALSKLWNEHKTDEIAADGLVRRVVPPTHTYECKWRENVRFQEDKSSWEQQIQTYTKTWQNKSTMEIPTQCYCDRHRQLTIRHTDINTKGMQA